MERLVLICANSFESAYKEAEASEHERSSHQAPIAIEGIKYTQEYIGIRKVIEISNPVTAASQSNTPPESLTEITYSNFEIMNQEELNKLILGEDTYLCYLGF
jgi:hypothetical protein